MEVLERTEFKLPLGYLAEEGWDIEALIGLGNRPTVAIKKSNERIYLSKYTFDSKEMLYRALEENSKESNPFFILTSEERNALLTVKFGRSILVYEVKQTANNTQMVVAHFESKAHKVSAFVIREGLPSRFTLDVQVMARKTVWGVINYIDAFFENEPYVAVNKPCTTCRGGGCVHCESDRYI